MCASRYSSCAGNSGRDMTPRQESLSGVIICPAYRVGQRLRVNSITTALITNVVRFAVNLLIHGWIVVHAGIESTRPVSARIRSCERLHFGLRWFPTQCQPLLVSSVWTITIRVFAATRLGIMSLSVGWTAAAQFWRSFANTSEDQLQRIRRSARGAAFELGFLSNRRLVGLGYGE
jgi:hypothetical protein